MLVTELSWVRPVILLLFLCTIVPVSAFNGLQFSGASGFEDIESGDWWYYPMVIEAGSTLDCSFSTNASDIEYFIIHEEYYVEHTEISENLLLYHGLSASADFEIFVPYEGGWFWVFINDSIFTLRVTYEWSSTAPFNLFAPQNQWIVNYSVLGVFCAAIILFFIRRKRLTHLQS
jgi:hypothetical protein